MGGVFSQTEGFTSVNQLWAGLAFHAISTGLGTAMLATALSRRRSAGIKRATEVKTPQAA